MIIFGCIMITFVHQRHAHGMIAFARWRHAKLATLFVIAPNLAENG